jgi:ATP-dependent helicase IRC3
MRDRLFQDAAVKASLDAYDSGVRKQLIVMATGTGKTHCFGRLYGEMKSRLPGKMLVLAHTDELVKQNAVVMAYHHGEANVSVEMGQTLYADPNSQIISASVQTLGRKGTKRGDNWDWDEFDKIVVDEAHHSTTDGYRRILERTGVLQSDSRKLLLGVTATPQRTDGIALSEIYDKVVYQYPIRQAIAEGWLVDVRGYRVSTSTSLVGVGSTSSGDFNLGELSERINTPQRNQQVVDAWKRIGERRKTIVYCADIKHAQDMANEFNTAGISADAMWGDDDERTQKLEQHSASRSGVLCVCGLLIEGYNDPSIACIVLARPSESVILLPQMIGRGTRLEDGVNLKDHEPEERVKRNLIVIYFADGKPEPSLVTLPTLMGLSNNLDLQGQSLLHAAETIEALQEENPDVDFSKLELLDKAKLFIEQVDMFRVNFPQEVQDNSELSWFRSASGGYKMLIPKEGPEPQGFVKLYENVLGQWEVDGEIQSDRFHGVRPTFEESIKVADEQIRKRVSKRTLGNVLREAKWHGKKVSPGQRGMLKRLFPWQHFNYDQMNSGQASKKIAEALTRRSK